MPELVYLNGAYVAAAEAKVSVMDRGLLFADSVYEVVSYYNGFPVCMDAHLTRLKRSMAAIRLDDAAVPAMDEISEELLKRCGYADAVVYWQVTRGAPDMRTHRFPAGAVEPTVFAFAVEGDPLDLDGPVRELRVGVHEDWRWGRCDIKSTALLPNVMAQQVSVDRGWDETLLVRDGVFTEATAKSAFFVKDGQAFTHPLNDAILSGVTRGLVFEAMMSEGVTCIEKPWPLVKLDEVDEVFLASTTAEVAAVVAVEGQAVGQGNPGEVTRRLHANAKAKIARMCRLIDKTE